MFCLLSLFEVVISKAIELMSCKDGISPLCVTKILKKLKKLKKNFNYRYF